MAARRGWASAPVRDLLRASLMPSLGCPTYSPQTSGQLRAWAGAHCPDGGDRDRAMVEHEPLSVSYRMTPAELLRASRRVLSPPFYYYSLLRQIIAYVSLCAVIVLSFCLTNRLMFHTCEYHFWIPFALFVLVVYGDAWIIRRNLSQREARSPAFGPHRMSITADGLVDETPVTR
jgi:hypothetical protein